MDRVDPVSSRVDTPEPVWTAEPSSVEVDEVVGLIDAATAADGVEPVSEAVLLRLRHAGRGEHLVVRGRGGVLVGYAGLERGDRASAEFVVHPDHRRRGVGTAVLGALLDRVPGPLWIWAHGEHPGALRLAERAGLRRRRELLQLRRGLTEPVAARAVPDGVTVRAFVPGADEAAVAEVNRRAFAWHPEQGQWDESEIVLREAEPWFDPAGFLLAVEQDGRLLGFHWTKVHPGGAGEVYVVGVDPDAQGRGLGAALTAAGLEHLRGRGVTEVLLYVEADNAAALRTYRGLGFTRHHSDVEFLRP